MQKLKQSYNEERFFKSRKLKSVLRGHTCAGNLYHVVYNGNHARSMQIPNGNPNMPSAGRNVGYGTQLGS